MKTITMMLVMPAVCNSQTLGIITDNNKVGFEYQPQFTQEMRCQQISL